MKWFDVVFWLSGFCVGCLVASYVLSFSRVNVNKLKKGFAEDLQWHRDLDRRWHQKAMDSLGRAQKFADILDAIGIDIHEDIDDMQMGDGSEFSGTTTVSFSYSQNGTIRGVHLVAVELFNHQDVYQRTGEHSDVVGA